MKRKIIRFYLNYGAIILIAVFAAAQFILILRHKSPYLSDSYFYQHVYYELNGDNFTQARQKIIEAVNLSQSDNITKNIFNNLSAYKNSYGFFVKRPLYPILAFGFGKITPSVYISFILPIFISYMGITLIIYYLSQKTLGKLFSVATTALFISFYPFLDWSTYFLTDTIGAFLWFVQLVLAYKVLTENKIKWLVYFAVALAVSLLNREQSVLMVPLILILTILLRLFKFPSTTIKGAMMLGLTSAFVVCLHIATSAILGQKNIIDTITYTQNSYGLENNVFSKQETWNYVVRSVKVAHIVFIRELVQHHWWFLISAISVLGVLKLFFIKKYRDILSLLVLSSAAASYLSIFIYPVLSYRYFFPVLFAITYFAAKFTKEYFDAK